ncbi:MAG: hypothetical protein M3R14_09365 [Acidobacteriota bacterium]|nr:hypothetical protein [Acidobacteriota bacterium]
MGRIDSNVTNRVNHNSHQQPKTERENNSSKVQLQPNARGKGNTNPSEQVAIKNGIDTSVLKLVLLGKLAAFNASETKGNEVKVTYVPVDQRHKGLSKYDILPFFANRPKGFPDRYRAVNPRLAAQGVKGEKALNFPLKDGKHILVDGNGVKRGAVGPSNVRLNYAQVKTINGEKHYYAFATSIDHDNNPKTKSIGASGWIKASAIKNGNDPKYTKEDIRRSQPPPVSEVHGKHEDYQQYVVKNVAPEQLTGKDGKPKYGYMENGKFVSYKVLPGVTKNERVAAGDYLRRDGNVINLGFNAAGLSNDTFKVDGTKPVVFHRAPTSVKSATIDIDLFHPKDKNHAGQKPVTRMRFVYGYVETQGTKRWGWMALGALERKDNQGK